MDTHLLVSIGLYVLWFSVAAFIANRLTYSSLSIPKKIGYIILWAILMAIMFGVPKGIAFLLLAPIAVFWIPVLVVKDFRNKNKNSDQ